MTPDQRFAVLMVFLTAILAGLGWLGKSVFGVVSQWARTGAKLEELSQDIRDLVTTKERDHARIDGRVDRLDERVTRHEGWHAEH